MPISLQKGQKVDLTKGNPGLKRLMVGLGWDVNQYDGGADFDLDAAAFMLGASGKVRKQEDFIFYGNLSHDSESVPVSYTHLLGQAGGSSACGEGPVVMPASAFRRRDRDERQTVLPSGNSGGYERQNQRPKENRTVPQPARRQVVIPSGAVSYTHLDVYKRQILVSACSHR